ncbi:MAG TPA: hypothetical protein VJI67_02820 [archaeon]|nr:hypothetical protein [archaeon]HLD80890.1 hypothetical protein [archaeon]
MALNWRNIKRLQETKHPKLKVRQPLPSIQGEKPFIVIENTFPGDKKRGVPQRKKKLTIMRVSGDRTEYLLEKTEGGGKHERIHWKTTDLPQEGYKVRKIEKRISVTRYPETPERGPKPPLPEKEEVEHTIQGIRDLGIWHTWKDLETGAQVEDYIDIRKKRKVLEKARRRKEREKELAGIRQEIAKNPNLVFFDKMGMTSDGRLARMRVRVEKRGELWNDISIKKYYVPKEQALPLTSIVKSEKGIKVTSKIAVNPTEKLSEKDLVEEVTVKAIKSDTGKTSDKEIKKYSINVAGEVAEHQRHITQFNKENKRVIEDLYDLVTGKWVRAKKVAGRKGKKKWFFFRNPDED